MPYAQLMVLGGKVGKQALDRDNFTIINRKP